MGGPCCPRGGGTLRRGFEPALGVGEGWELGESSELARRGGFHPDLPLAGLVFFRSDLTPE